MADAEGGRLPASDRAAAFTAVTCPDVIARQLPWPSAWQAGRGYRRTAFGCRSYRGDRAAADGPGSPVPREPIGRRGAGECQGGGRDVTVGDLEEAEARLLELGAGKSEDQRAVTGGGSSRARRGIPSARSEADPRAVRGRTGRARPAADRAGKGKWPSPTGDAVRANLSVARRKPRSTRSGRHTSHISTTGTPAIGPRPVPKEQRGAGRTAGHGTGTHPPPGSGSSAGSALTRGSRRVPRIRWCRFSALLSGDGAVTLGFLLVSGCVA
ncbi:hypothetical protein JOF35_008133 [Streptomyces demainii]|uniref:Uncharacterized protein n=1 Tax=Streptomyces demainii TaxID=588122 RepID=A0ABT9L516_9ACTN|nr:hypothetical protein [Streptomyces demainii]